MAIHFQLSLIAGLHGAAQRQNVVLSREWLISPKTRFCTWAMKQSLFSVVLCRGHLITISGVTTKMDLTVSRLLHNVDIVVSVIRLKYINPLTDWYSGNVFMPNFIPSALFVGTRLSAEHEIGIVRVFSSWRGCEKMSKWGIHYWLFWNPLHSDIIQIRCRISCRGGSSDKYGLEKTAKSFCKSYLFKTIPFSVIYTREDWRIRLWSQKNGRGTPQALT